MGMRFICQITQVPLIGLDNQTARVIPRIEAGATTVVGILGTMGGVVEHFLRHTFLTEWAESYFGKAFCLRFAHW